MLKRLQSSPELRFTAPVILENVATVLIGLIFSSIIGGISESALAAVGLVNTIMNVLTSSASFLTTGSSVLTARLVGEGDKQATSRAVEQSLLLAVLTGAVIFAVCELTAAPVMRLLLPGAEESVYLEGLTYYRALLLSFPLLMIYNTICGLLRAAGESGGAMVSGILMNLVQILAAFVLISVLGMNVVGAGLAYAICRAAGLAVVLVPFLRSHRHFHIHLRGVFTPSHDMLRRILRLGAPASLESFSVQLCYLLTNSIAMSLGTLEAASYQVMNTLTSFSNLSFTIYSIIGVTIIGQALGAGNVESAKAHRRSLYLSAMLVTLGMSVLLALLGPILVPLYTRDAYVAQRSRQLLWMAISFALPGISINVNDPILRVGGDARYVMWYTMASVWLIRLPLTWLFCYPLNLGAVGVLLANSINCIVRAAFGAQRIRKGKWLYNKV